MPAIRGSTAVEISPPGGGVHGAKCEAVEAAAEVMPPSAEYLRASRWVRYIKEVTDHLEGSKSDVVSRYRPKAVSERCESVGNQGCGCWPLMIPNSLNKSR